MVAVGVGRPACGSGMIVFRRVSSSAGRWLEYPGLVLASELR